MISENAASSSSEDEEGPCFHLMEEFRQEIEQIWNSSHYSKKTGTTAITPINDDKHDDAAFMREQIAEECWTRFSANHGVSPCNANNNVSPKGKGGRRLAQDKENHGTSQNKEAFPFSPPSRNYSQARKMDKNSNLILKRFLQIAVWSLRLIYMALKICGAAILTLFVLYCIFILHKPTQRLVSRNTQDLIYPLMRALRLISIPVVRRFPFLTDYYEESCLIPNPYYEVAELECWPCESVRHVMDLTGVSNFSSAYHHSGIPFVVKDAFLSEISMEKIRQVVSKNSDLLGKSFVETSHFGVTTLENIVGLHYSEAFNSDDFHMKWYINRVGIARLWKNYFPKPYFIPKSTEVSVQHFLFVDRPLSKTYRLPLTEFANVFLTQASGSRSIVLIPTKNCQKECKVVSAVLKEKDVLFYNWLFWRVAMSVAADSTAFQTTSVTFIGSFY